MASLIILLAYSWARLIPNGQRFLVGGFISDLTALLAAICSLIFLCLCLWQPHSRTNTVSELQTKLSSAEGKSDIVINAINDGVLAIAPNGLIELINPAAERILGWRADDALGLNWRSVVRLTINDNQPAADAHNPIVQALMHDHPASSDKFMLQTISDKQILVSVVASPIGRDEGIIVVFRDITKERAEERQQAEFISTASHEMRTPVASIEGYLGLVLNPATATIDERARDFITKAHDAACHLGRLFQDLLDVSRAEDGRLGNNPKVINVNEFIKEIFDSLKSLADAKGLTYIFKPAEDLDVEGAKTLRPVFYANIDPDHLREVAGNLIENAIKYTPEGHVIVDLNGSDASIYVNVQDTGIGIPAEDVPHLFQKFYRVDNSDTREINGTGLGLYLSRRLAETMGGTLTVESEYRSGSTFTLEIPRMHNDEAVEKLRQQKVTSESWAQDTISSHPFSVSASALDDTASDDALIELSSASADNENYSAPERHQLTIPKR